MWYYKNEVKLFFIIVLICLLGIFLSRAYGLDRCQEYITDVRIQHHKYLGPNYPYWYGLGKLRQESNCRADAVSFDGGLGIGQFTPSTGVGKEIEKEIPNINYLNPEQSIRASAYYTSRIIKVHFRRNEFKFRGKSPINPRKYTEKCGLRLSDVYQYYNGGFWAIYEASKTNTCDRIEMRKNCTRGGVWVSGRYLNFCDINYSYPLQVYKFSQKYNPGGYSGDWGFW